MKNLIRLIACGLVLIALPCLAGYAKYYAPYQKFSASVNIKDAGKTSLAGSFKAGTGSFRYAPDIDEISDIRFAINAGSISATEGNDTKTLGDLFDVSTHEIISFSARPSIKLEEGKAKIEGKLTFHGTAQNVSLDASLSKPEGERGRHYSSRSLSLKGYLNCEDFSIKSGKHIELTATMNGISVR